jgi:hypothetical protein
MRTRQAPDLFTAPSVLDTSTNVKDTALIALNSASNGYLLLFFFYTRREETSGMTAKTSKGRACQLLTGVDFPSIMSDSAR